MQRRAFLLVPVLLAVCSAIAAAQPVVRHTWTQFDHLDFNQDFTGPGTYAQTLSVAGGTQPWTGFVATLVTGAGLPPAWDFEAGGCQGPGRLTAQPSVAGCDAIPGLTVSVQMFPHITDPRRHYIVVQGSIQPGFPPDPARRYGLATLLFDHSQTFAGLVGTGCGEGDLPYCIHLEGVTLYTANGPAEFGLNEGLYLYWNSPTGTEGCDGPTPARPSTWGRVKAIYR